MSLEFQSAVVKSNLREGHSLLVMLSEVFDVPSSVTTIITRNFCHFTWGSQTHRMERKGSCWRL